jgi:hypothetical protein
VFFGVMVRAVCDRQCDSCTKPILKGEKKDKHLHLPAKALATKIPRRVIKTPGTALDLP